MEVNLEQLMYNAKAILEFVPLFAETTEKIMQLTRLDGLTQSQKEQIETALTLIHLSRAKLLAATYPDVVFK